MIIKKIVFVSLLSLSVLALSAKAVDFIADKVPFDTDKAKTIILIIILIVSIIVLKKEFSYKLSKTCMKQLIRSKYKDLLE